MEKDLLIHQLLEGSLDSAQEDSLFLELSSNEELRKELKEQLLLKNAMQNDTVAFTPKADSTTKIFSELGISEVLGAASVGATSGFLSNFWSYFQSPFVSSLVTAGVMISTFVGMNQLGIIGFENGEEKENLAKIPVSRSIEIENDYNQKLQEKEKNFNNLLASKNSEISKLNSELNSSNSQISFLQNQINNLNNIINEINIFKGSDQTSEENIADNSDLYSSKRELYSVELSNIYSDEQTSSFNKIDKQILSINDQRDPLFSNNSNKQLYLPVNFGLEFGGFYDNQLGEASAAAQSHLDLQGEINSNLRFAAYNQIGNWKVGFDVRRENFYQRFSFTNNGEYNIYEQNPNFWSFSGFTRFNPSFAKFDLAGVDFDPFAQITAGFASPAGPVGRVMLGSEVSFLNYNHFTFGLEYSFLQYQQSGIDYQADKLSLQIGIGIGSAK